MSNQPTNRLDSYWLEPSANGSDAALAGAKQLANKLEPMFQNVETAIAEYPRTSLTVAAALGAVFGWFIKRK